MRSYRTSSLFHYTKKIEALKRILQDGIKPNYAKESFVDGKIIIGIPMISFCDIPLSMASKMKSYGNYCIGFNKQWGISKKANPILYYHNFDDEYTMTYQLHDRLKNAYYLSADKFKKNDESISSMFGERGNYHQMYHISRYMFGFSKPYHGNNGKHDNYEENEWRIVLEEGSSQDRNSVSWLWGAENCKEWRGEGEKPKSEFDALPFNASDINFIVVKNESMIDKMIHFIGNLKELSGVTISDTDRKNLLTKITSFERIKNN